MAALSGKGAKIRLASVSGTASTDNAATRSTGVVGTGYVQINATGRRHWDRDVVPVLADSGTPVSAALYTVNPVQGRFEWLVGDPPVGTYTIDCDFLTDTYLTGGQSWSVDSNVDMLDTTSFATSTGSQQWRTFIPGLSQASVSIERLVSTGDTGPVFYDRLNLQSAFIVELFTEDFDKFEGYAYVSADGWNAAIDGITAESVDMTIDNTLYFSTS